MEYAIGFITAVAVGLFGTVTGFDKERSFYSVILVVVALYYILFAAMAGSTNALLSEAIPVLLFATAAAIGFRRSMWIVAAGLVAHGLFDFAHHRVIANPGVPAWWPGFCAAYDVTAGVYLGVLIVRRTRP